MTSFYGSSCANNGKGALNTHRSRSPFLTALSSSPLSPTALPLGPANITRGSVCLAVLHRLYASCSASLVLFNPTAVAVPSTVLSVLVLLTLAPLSSGLVARLRPLFLPPRLSAAPSRRPALPARWVVSLPLVCCSGSPSRSRLRSPPVPPPPPQFSPPSPRCTSPACCWRPCPLCCGLCYT